MTYSRANYYIVALFRNILSQKGFAALLSIPGAAVTVWKTTDTFFHDTKAPEYLHAFFNAHWLGILITAVVYAFYCCWPKGLISARLDGRDVQIEIAIGDIFSFSGAIVVGSNTTFDTHISEELISKSSVQGMFTERYYSSEDSLEKELNVTLGKINQVVVLQGERVGKNKQYPIGTVVKVTPKDRTGYFLAISDINAHGNAVGTFEGVKDSLAALWAFIGDRGSKDEPILIPVLGTGFGRLTQPRAKLVQEIIKSFVAACSEKTFCEKLTIVLHDKDVLEHKVNVEALGNYLKHVCTYAEFAPSNAPKVGTAIA